MKILFLNLPYKEPIMRRYTTTYYAPNFLLPPYELMSLATIASEWKKAEVLLIDAIAEKLKMENIFDQIKKFRPSVIVSMPGFETFSIDVENLNFIKKEFPELRIIAFGYLASLYSEELLKNSKIDIVIKGEPEIIFSYLYDILKNDSSLHNLLGISFVDGEQIVSTPNSSRIDELNIFPFPKPDLINLKLYKEPFLGKPMMAFYSLRGCIGTCNYCVKSYGPRIHAATPESTVKCLTWYKKNFKIRSFRFLDDNFTADKKRVLEICRLIKVQKLNIKWACLSRIDTLDYELAKNMKKAGCKRIYLGIESGSNKILDFYKKNYSTDDVRTKTRILHKLRINIVGFFIVGAPIETDEDVEASINLAIQCNFDFIIVTRLKFVPGTALFEQYKENINFSLFPYKSVYGSKQYEQQTLIWEKMFYKKFYFRLGYYIRKFMLIFISPVNIIQGILLLLNFFKDSKTKRDFI